MKDAIDLAPLGRGDHAALRERLRLTAEDNGLDGVLLLKPMNVAYASGFFHIPNERPVGLYIAVDHDPILFVPEIERENAEPAGIEVRCYFEFPGPVHPVLWMVQEIGMRAVAFDHLDAVLLPAVRDRLRRLDLRDFAMEQRYVKSAAELELVRAAARHADAFLQHLLAVGGDIIAHGGTEQDLLAECIGHATAGLKARRGRAFEGTPLRIVATVHSGPRAALPHGLGYERTPQPGDTVIAGIGACLGGYHAESGATFTVGEPSNEQRRVFAAMQACNDAAIDALRPRVRCEDVNEAALDAIRGAGFGDAIRHRIGHGMGLEAHEAPWLAPGDRTQAVAGMVFSNEPGIYRPGIDGYRTINTMIVTDQDVEVPSRFLADTPPADRILAV